MERLSHESTYPGLFCIRHLVILSRNVSKQREGVTEMPSTVLVATVSTRLFLEDRILLEEKQFSRNPGCCRRGGEAFTADEKGVQILV